MQSQDFSGVWRSKYEYHSSSRKKTFQDEHIMRARQKGNTLVFESIPDKNASYLFIKLSVDGNIATGSWQEVTDKNGYYGGATYYGAIQMIISEDAKHMSGKWAGFDKSVKVNVGPWELTYQGEDSPTETQGM